MALACSQCHNLVTNRAGVSPAGNYMLVREGLEGVSCGRRYIDTENDAVVEEIGCENCGQRLGRRFLATSVKLAGLTGCTVLDTQAIKGLSQEKELESRWRELRSLEPRLCELEGTLEQLQKAVRTLSHWRPPSH